MVFLSRFIPILVCAALFSNVVQAQSVGTVTGTVADAASGEKLEVVQVHIPTLKLGVVSDAQGRFTIPNVPVGVHELKADLIGYASATVAITVTAGQTVTVALQMNHSALYLDEVVVTGTAFKESPISLTYAVAVVGREKMAEQGSPQAVDFLQESGCEPRRDRRAQQLVQCEPGWYPYGEYCQCEPARAWCIADAGVDQ